MAIIPGGFDPSDGFYPDPAVIDWRAIDIPDAWPDQLSLMQVIRHLVMSLCFNRRQPVVLPENLPGSALIPKYILQEFHGLPNGNYSKRITRGYSHSFDRSMLGLMGPARERIARRLRHASSVLDIGCAAGHTAGCLSRMGVKDVWGLDPSPYLLQQAANHYTDVNFIQGLAESTAFKDQRFEGVSATFVLHEIPPKHLNKVFAELYRLLAEGGLLVICEPSPVQLNSTLGSLVKKYGWRGAYFYWFARRVHEPFVGAWHELDIAELLSQHGFELVEDELGMPLRHIVARKLPVVRA